MIEDGGSAPVRLLDPWQVDDPQKGCFYVKLEPTSERYRRLRVYKDACGTRIAIRGTR